MKFRVKESRRIKLLNFYSTDFIPFTILRQHRAAGAKPLQEFVAGDLQT